MVIIISTNFSGNGKTWWDWNSDGTHIVKTKSFSSEEIYDRYKDLVDIVIDGGAGENEESTVVDCTDNEIVIIRQGKGLLDE